MILNTTRRFSVLLILACFASVSLASELSDSMQLFFDGEYKNAHQRLTTLIDQGHVDARLHFFRGLASGRLGDRQAASTDFRRGAELELSGAGYGAGRALQRVQGADRLLLEKYRTMARLAIRHRAQPIAPKPKVASTSDISIPLVPTERPIGVPLFRLASEIPLRELGASDPFTDDPNALLAEERMPTGPEVTPPTAGQEDVPVGTGVASSPAEADDFDPFSEPGFSETSPAPAPLASSPSTTGSATKSSGVVGAIFRALTRAAVPKVPGSMIPRGVFPESNSSSAGAPAFDPNDDPFGDGSAEDGSFEPDDTSDPFGDF